MGRFFFNVDVGMNFFMRSKLVYRRAAVLLNTCLMVLLVVACGTMGENGELRLSDVNAQQPGALYPIAVGTDVHYRIEQANTVRSRLVGAQVSTATPDLVDVTLSDDKKEVIATGKKAGMAKVTVTTEDEKEDTFTLEVRDADHAMFNVERQKNAGAHHVATITSSAKLNMPPGSKLTVKFRNFTDVNNQPLAGEPASIHFGEPVVSGNFVATKQAEGLRWIVQAGDEGSSVTIANPYGDDWVIRAKEDIEVADFTVLSNAGLKANKPLEHEADTWFIPRRTTVMMQFTALDADGYAYVGQESLHAEAALNNADFQSELASGIWQMDGANTCSESLDAETPGACNAWTNLTELRFQLYGPDKDTSADLMLSVGDYQKSITLQTQGDASSVDENDDENSDD